LAKTTIVVGVLLILLGVVGYVGLFGGGAYHTTALIPAFAGVVFAVLGALAMNPAYRKHAMHGAAMLGLLGFLGGAMGIVKLLKWMGGTEPARPGAVIAQTVMAVICAGFVVLCVRSFIAARKAREAASAVAP
jgi:hypothetical protein